MRWVAAGTVFLLPVAIAPGFFFYHDVTPKAVIVFVGAALGLIIETLRPNGLEQFFASRQSRRFAFLCGVLILVNCAASAFAAYPDLAWGGSNWRRLGTVSVAAAITLSALLSAHAARSERDRVGILRSLCLAGIVASAYGILQYFGWDPLLPGHGYETGEGPFRIVRPPGTMGHADYFAAFLLWPIFGGVALFRSESARLWKQTGTAATVLGSAALILSGSRGAALGLAAGTVTALLLTRPSRRAVLAVAGGGLLLATVFYASPAGQRLRARAHWVAEEPLGGGRPLLWRDSLQMAAARPILGFGPDNFVAEFPQFQSVQLARAYPDFYHESPHNLLLDALTAEGLVGLLVLIALCIIGFRAGWQARFAHPSLAPPLACGLLAALVAHQFAVLTLPALVFFLLFVGLLVTLSPPATEPPRGLSGWTVRIVAAMSACFFVSQGLALAVTDHRLAAVMRHLDAGAVSAAGEQYRTATQTVLSRLPFPAVQADLYFSRRFAAAIAAVPDARSKLFCAQLTVESALRATHAGEQQANAWYNLALLMSARGDTANTEASLRRSIATAPRWFKPHWALAQLLHETGRARDAEVEARLTLDLDAGKNTKVVTAMEEILRSTPQTR